MGVKCQESISHVTPCGMLNARRQQKKEKKEKKRKEKKEAFSRPVCTERHKTQDAYGKDVKWIKETVVFMMWLLMHNTDRQTYASMHDNTKTDKEKHTHTDGQMSCVYEYV